MRRWDIYSAWFTPCDLAEQGQWGAAQLGVQPDRVIDLGAGAGGITSRLRRVYPHAVIVAIETREEEREHLERWADIVIIGDFRDLDPSDPRLGKAGERVLVTGNPPYTDTAEHREKARHLVSTAEDTRDLDLTTQAIRWAFGVGTWVFFLLRKSYEEGEAACAFFRPASEGGRPPIADLRIPGRANFRRGVNDRGSQLAGDFIGHRWVLWKPGTHGWCWVSATLPLLPSASLSYVMRPGTELAAGALYEGHRPNFPRLEGCDE